MADDNDGIPDDDIWNIDFEQLFMGQELARGSFGKVYRGEYLGMDVAIKQIIRHNDPAYMKYIEREISVLKGVRHPLIVGFVGVCLHETGLYIVTEFIDGGDVRNLIKDNDVDWERKIQIAEDLAKSMFYLHSKKIIHRDLKCKNLLIGLDGRVRLCDFGFARLSDAFDDPVAAGLPAAAGGDRARAMTICGTPGFVAPEIMLGREYDAKCDMFSYGNVLAELVTEKRPGREFWKRAADTQYVLDFQQLRDMATPTTPKDFVELAIRCCAYKPEERPDFPEILAALKLIRERLPRKPRMSMSVHRGLPPGVSAPAASGTTSSGSAGTGAASGNAQQYNVVGVVDLGSAVNAVDGDLLKQVVTGQQTLTSGELGMSENHLKKMLARATSPDMMDSEYVADLILMYPCFATPVALLGVCAERYSEQATEIMASMAEEDGLEKKKRCELVQMRVVVFLNTWIESYPDDFSMPDMERAISLFDGAASTGGSSAFSIKQGLASLSTKRRATVRHPKPAFLKQINAETVPLDASFFVGVAQPASLLSQKAGSRSSIGGFSKKKKKKDSGPTHVFVSPFAAQSWAQQLSLVSQALYRAIKPREFLKESWKVLDDSNVKNLMQHSEHVGRWAASIVVSLVQQSARVCAISKLIDISQHLLNLRDYNSFFGIVMLGLMHPAVERLTESWDLLSPSSKQLWEQSKELVNKADSFRVYKDLHAKSMPPTIPFMSVFLDELSYVDSFNPDIGQGGIINFSKHRKMAYLIRGLETLGSVSYEFQQVPELQQHILRSRLLEIDHLEKQSMLVQAPNF